MVIRGLVGGGMLEPEEVNMFAHRRPDEPLAGLQVYAQGTFPVEVSKKGMKSKPAERVPLLPRWTRSVVRCASMSTRNASGICAEDHLVVSDEELTTRQYPGEPWARYSRDS